KEISAKASPFLQQAGLFTLQYHHTQGVSSDKQDVLPELLAFSLSHLGNADLPAAERLHWGLPVLHNSHGWGERLATSLALPVASLANRSKGKSSIRERDLKEILKALSKVEVDDEWKAVTEKILGRLKTVQASNQHHSSDSSSGLIILDINIKLGKTWEALRSTMSHPTYALKSHPASYSLLLNAGKEEAISELFVQGWSMIPWGSYSVPALYAVTDKGRALGMKAAGTIEDTELQFLAKLLVTSLPVRSKNPRPNHSTSMRTGELSKFIAPFLKAEIKTPAVRNACVDLLSFTGDTKKLKSAILERYQDTLPASLVGSDHATRRARAQTYRIYLRCLLEQGKASLFLEKYKSLEPHLTGNDRYSYRDLYRGFLDVFAQRLMTHGGKKAGKGDKKVACALLEGAPVLEYSHATLFANSLALVHLYDTPEAAAAWGKACKAKKDGFKNIKNRVHLSGLNGLFHRAMTSQSAGTPQEVATAYEAFLKDPHSHVVVRDLSPKTIKKHKDAFTKRHTKRLTPKPEDTLPLDEAPAKSKDGATQAPDKKQARAVSVVKSTPKKKDSKPQ
ncbi:MAG: hypothetical protein ACYTGH_21670, partial [Planctomycetota bacterium]